MEYIDEKKRANMKKVFIIVGIILAMILLAVGLGYLKIRSVIQKEKEVAYQLGIEEGIHNGKVVEVSKDVTVSVKTLREVIAPASDLVTYRYYYTNADTYEKSKNVWKVKLPFTTDKEVYVLSGVISAGIDVGKVEFSVDDEKKTIEVKMPEPVIVSHEIDADSFKTYNIKNSVFTASKLEDYVQFQEAIKATQEERLEDNDLFWEQAKNQSKNIITSLLTVSGATEDYEVNYIWADKETE